MAQEIAGPYPEQDVTKSLGAVIVTSVGNTGNGAETKWFERRGSAAFGTEIRTTGTSLSVGSLGREVTLALNQGAVVTEVFLPRDPWRYSRGIWSLVQGGEPAPPGRLAAFALQRPRVTAILQKPVP